MQKQTAGKKLERRNKSEWRSNLWRNLTRVRLLWLCSITKVLERDKNTSPEKVSEWNESVQLAGGKSHHSSVSRIIVERSRHLCSQMLVSHFWWSFTSSLVSPIADMLNSLLKFNINHAGAYMFKEIEQQNSREMKKNAGEGRKNLAENLWKRTCEAVNTFNQTEFEIV